MTEGRLNERGVQSLQALSVMLREQVRLRTLTPCQAPAGVCTVSTSEAPLLLLLLLLLLRPTTDQTQLFTEAGLSW